MPKVKWARSKARDIQSILKSAAVDPSCAWTSTQALMLYWLNEDLGVWKSSKDRSTMQSHFRYYGVQQHPGLTWAQLSLLFHRYRSSPFFFQCWGIFLSLLLLTKQNYFLWRSWDTHRRAHALIWWLEYSLWKYCPSFKACLKCICFSSGWFANCFLSPAAVIQFFPLTWNTPDSIRKRRHFCLNLTAIPDN